eukprot:2701872-Prymnesium_polylepis.1
MSRPQHSSPSSTSSRSPRGSLPPDLKKQSPRLTLDEQLETHEDEHATRREMRTSRIEQEKMAALRAEARRHAQNIMVEADIL